MVVSSSQVDLIQMNFGRCNKLFIYVITLLHPKPKVSGSGVAAESPLPPPTPLLLWLQSESLLQSLDVSRNVQEIL